MSDDGHEPAPALPSAPEPVPRNMALRALVYMLGLVLLLPGLCSLLFSPVWIDAVRSNDEDALMKQVAVVVAPAMIVLLSGLVLRHARQNRLSGRDLVFLLLSIGLVAVTLIAYDGIQIRFQ